MDRREAQNPLAAVLGLWARLRSLTYLYPRRAPDAGGEPSSSSPPVGLSALLDGHPPRRSAHICVRRLRLPPRRSAPIDIPKRQSPSMPESDYHPVLIPASDFRRIGQAVRMLAAPRPKPTRRQSWPGGLRDKPPLTQLLEGPGSN